MSRFDYDLFVIAAGYGARVGICEESRVGGTCVIRDFDDDVRAMVTSGLHVSWARCSRDCARLRSCCKIRG
ncbi:MAG: hypothetical protein L3J24_00435 [Xanthomonadales bacterium]|nr:hypothetical protein [Xanthomonadales bacterium]